MSEFRGVLKYNLYKVYKSKILFISFFIVLLGMAEVSWSALTFNKANVYFLNFIEDSWMTVAIVTFPLIFIGIHIGSDEEVLVSLNTKSAIKQYLGGFIAILSIDLILFGILTVFYFFFLLVYFKLTISYGVYYLASIAVSFIISSLVYSNIGLLLGILFGKYLKGVIAYILAVAVFLITAGIGKATPGYIYLNNVSRLPPDFEPIIQNKYYDMGIKLWLGILLIIILSVIGIFLIKKRSKVGYYLVLFCIVVAALMPKVFDSATISTRYTN